MEFAWIVIVLSMLHSSFSVDWCDKKLNCEVPNGTGLLILKNTACEKVEPESMHHCQRMLKRPENSVNQTLLAMHNTFRNRVASGDLSGWPAASDMRQLTWDDSLAEQALSWAFQCDDKEDDPCKTHPVYDEDEGQNLGLVVQSSASASPPDLADVFSKWITEALNASPSIVDQMVPGEHLHFAQIIYFNNQKVGCGVIDYEDESGQKAIRIVCNYDVQYNFGDRLYTKGDDCGCPPDTSCKNNSTYKKLCARTSDPTDENPVVVDFYEMSLATESPSSPDESMFETPTVPEFSNSVDPNQIPRAKEVPVQTTLRQESSQPALRGCPLTCSIMALQFLGLF